MIFYGPSCSFSEALFSFYLHFSLTLVSGFLNVVRPAALLSLHSHFGLDQLFGPVCEMKCVAHIFCGRFSLLLSIHVTTGPSERREGARQKFDSDHRTCWLTLTSSKTLHVFRHKQFLDVGVTVEKCAAEVQPHSSQRMVFSLNHGPM